jgi:hypothetical protein
MIPQVTGKVFFKYYSKVLLGRPGRRTIIISKVKMSDPILKSVTDDLSSILKNVYPAEIVP